MADSDALSANRTDPVDIDSLVGHFERLMDAGDGQTAPSEAVREAVDVLEPHDQALLLDRLDEAARQSLFEALPPEDGAELVARLSDEQAASVIGDLAPVTAAQVCGEMWSEDLADVLGELHPTDAESVLAAMPPEEAKEARRLTQYADDVAGGLMGTEFLAVPSSATVGEVIDTLTAGADEYRDYDVQYVYVIEQTGQLVGVLPLRELVLSKRARPVTEVMIASPLRLADVTPLDSLDDFFESHAFFGVPIVDEADRILGIVRRASVEEALANRADDTYRKSQGLVAEELRSMPLRLRSGRRLAWLSINILLNAVAASVIIAFESTLQQVIALAVFLPIISDMSGCSGGQAVAVTMRELSLGLARPTDVVYVWLKEISVGLINGLVLGLLLGSGAILMYGNPWLGFVVGGALAVNTMVAVSIGGTIPLLLKRMKFDPAVASGPLLTTVTDMCGFFVVLGLATTFLSKLVAQS